APLSAPLVLILAGIVATMFRPLIESVGIETTSILGVLIGVVLVTAVGYAAGRLAARAKSPGVVHLRGAIVLAAKLMSGRRGNKSADCVFRPK
ncbi:MAG TPA: hypothetical protein VNO35_26065, partial [Steroidobacteraceae bacterium]|nr:hypothetical protein [Steroidobacteraceae bacterium]